MDILKPLKNHIKQILIRREHRRYEEILQKEKKNYHEWILDKESKVKQDKKGNVIENYILPYSECGLNFLQKIEETEEDIIIFHGNDGRVSELAESLIIKCMASDPLCILIYGDEDQITGYDEKNNIIRGNPWFKPDWSPDTFLSSFYLGNIFAVRRMAALEILQDMRKNEKISPEPQQNLYILCKELAEANEGFARRQAGTASPCGIVHIPEVLFHGNGEPMITKGNFKEEYSNCDDCFISVIIPTKDHPDILKRCLLSFIENTKIEHTNIEHTNIEHTNIEHTNIEHTNIEHTNIEHTEMEDTKNNRYQFIIVDNGSEEKNKKETEEFLKKLNQEEKLFFPAIYDYHKMPFNFSAMCNRGASLARKESDCLLFLNDDMEICQPDWLDRLVGKALLDRTGAVGAKLLYPESDMIQHAGITNLRVGPAHKLQRLSDSTDHYFGKNRGVHNVMAVTGACLMIRKSVFESVGGFPEELAVAFNDVDFCYTLWEKGYYNTVLNDVILYHHESLSRGNDSESREKSIRLTQEHDLLYRRHWKLYARDPYYHKYLVTDTLVPDYVPALHYEVDLEMPWAVVTADNGVAAHCWEDACLRIGVECTTDIFQWKHGVSPEDLKNINEISHLEENPVTSTEDKGYYLQGYSFVIGGDNACYERVLLMKNIDCGEIWQVSVLTKYREDVRNGLRDQLNVDLTGFSTKIKCDAVPAGTYSLGMMVKDRCSRQKIVNWSERELVVRERTYILPFV